MPNSLGSAGLTTATQTELVAQYTSAFQAIYGASINIGPETPDGQLIFTFVQSVVDVENLLAQIYNTFDPDNAIGTVLDQRVAINGIQRQAGTFTVTDVTLVTSQSVNLYGLDQTANPVYTVADAAGNQWELQTTQLGLSTGSNSLAFQAASPGAIVSAPNTIQVPVTIVLGVTSINNPTSYSVLGINEETDAQLKIRRQKSVSLPSQGYLAGLLAALENISGVTYATVQENTTGTTFSSGSLDGLPGHSIWVIVAGSGSPADIANAIYTKRNAGCGMYGSQSYVITQVDGSLFTVYWDDVVEVPLFTQVVVSSINGVTPPNISAIQGSLPSLFIPGVFASVNANEVSTLVQDIDPNTLAYPVTFSTTVGGSYTSILSPALANKQFSVAGSDVIVIPMYVSSTNTILSVPAGTPGSVIAALTISTLGTQTFIPNGGYATYSWALTTNNSGGSINSATGLYTAGSLTGTDVAKVTDSFPSTANTAIVTITVT